MADKWSIGFAIFAIPVLVAFAVHEKKNEQALRSEREQRHLEMEHDRVEDRARMDRFEKRAEILKERITLLHDVNAWGTKIARFNSKCANLEHQDWVARKCEADGKALVSTGDKLEARETDINTRENQLNAGDAQ